MAWMLLVLLYGILKGVREVIKKQAMTKSSVMEVLFLYTLLGFIFVIPDYKNATGMEPIWFFYVAVKSGIIFLAWILSFKAIKRMPISLYGVLDLSRVLFATLLGTIVLQEVLSTSQIIGLVFVSAGLLLLCYKPGFLRTLFGVVDKVDLDTKQKHHEPVDKKMVLYAFFSCLLNAISGTMDKVLMKDMTSSQLQFWYMFFLVLMYGAYIVLTRTKVHMKSLIKNYWIWILSILFIIADRALFIANGMEDSRVTIMTLIKQSGSLVTIVAGKVIFQEQHIRYKLFCAAVIVFGIMIAVL